MHHRHRQLCLYEISFVMLHVILPTDFSDNSLHAGRYAARLLGVDEVSWTVVHMYLDADPTVTSWAGMAEELYKAAMQGMQDWESRLRADEVFKGAKLHCEVQYGPLTGVLNDLSAERGVDLVVMGTLGRTGSGILGSNAAAVVKHSRTPVLVVPAKARPGATRRILFADDQRGVGEADARMLLHIAKRTGAEVVLAHVLRHADELPDPRLVAKFGELFRAMPHRFASAEGKDIAGVIDLLAGKEQADMIAVMHRHAGFFEGLFRTSTAKRLALHTDVPLLVLQEGRP